MQGATDRCQILSKNFAPSKALDAQAYMWHATAFDSRDIHAQHQSFFLSPQFIIMLHLGHSKTEHVLPAAFRGGCRGFHKAALHLLSNIPVSFPRMSLSVSLRREDGHKGPLAAGAHKAAWCGNGEREIHMRFAGLATSLQRWNTPKSW